MLDAADRAAYEDESQQLRLALKTWETTWAREHGGAKPAREDISRNPEIAKKYRAYNHTRAILSGKVSAAPNAKKDESRRKRKETSSAATADADTHHMQTPSKRLRATVTRATPSKTAATPTQGGGGYLDAHLNMTPSISRKLFSPVVPTSIGPTPQRDGRVLGLFDVLNEEEEKRKKRSAVAATPSKRAAAEAEATARGQTRGQVSVAVLGATPRKQTMNMEGYKSDDGEDDDDNIVNARRLGRTPMSSARRNLLNHFTAGGAGPTIGMRDAGSALAALGTTPLKTRHNDNLTQQSLLTTPSKGSGLQQAFATPAFLRRQSSALPPVDENGEFMSPPGKLRLPRKPLVRGLSSVLASLRKTEDEQLDEQLDVLRELESGMDMNAPSLPKPKTATVAPQLTMAAQLGQPLPPTSITNSNPVGNQNVGVEVEESQLLEDLEQYERLMGPELDATTERQQPRLLGGFDDEGLYDSAPEDQVGRDGQPLRVYKKKGQKRTTRRSNMRPTRTKRPAADTVAENDSEDENGEDGVGDDSLAVLSGSEFGSDAEGGNKSSKAKKAAADKKATSSKDGPVKKVVRKVNELAHANFKRLKLRNRGSKGGPGSTAVSGGSGDRGDETHVVELDRIHSR